MIILWGIYFIVFLKISALEVVKAFPFQVLPSERTNFTINLLENHNIKEVSCYFGKKKIPSYLSLDIIKCEIPIKTTRFLFYHINLVLTQTNGTINNYTIPEKIMYLKEPILLTLFPSFLPSSGGVIYLSGDNFYPLYNTVLIQLNKKYQFNCTILLIGQISCNITNIPIKKIWTYNISIILNNKTYKTELKMNFYGIKHISPSKGPIEKSMMIKVYGYGFSGDIQAYCLISDYTTEAKVLNASLISCSSSVSELEEKEQYNHYVVFSIRIMEKSQENLTRIYSYEINNLWVKSDISLFFYISANATKIIPSKVFINEIVILSVYSSNVWSFKNVLVGDTNFPKEIISNYYGDKIYCKFGEFGTTKGVYKNENMINCPTPEIKTDLAMIFEVEKTLSLSFNGKTFIENTGINIKFVGVTSPIVYTWVFVGFFLGMSMMVGLVVLCLNYNKKKD